MYEESLNTEGSLHELGSHGNDMGAELECLNPHSTLHVLSSHLKVTPEEVPVPRDKSAIKRQHFPLQFFQFVSLFYFNNNCIRRTTLPLRQLCLKQREA